MAGRKKRTLEQVLSSLARARRRVDADTKELARLSRPSASPLRCEPGGGWRKQVLDACRQQLVPGNAVGLGLGVKRTGKQDTGVSAALVYVPKKLSRRQLSRNHLEVLPETLRYRGRELPVDVQEIGRLRRQYRPGDGFGPKGGRGTLGAFAQDAQGQWVAITAMHVSNLKEFPDGDVEGPRFFTRARDGGRSVAMGRLLQGTRRDVDAARIGLDNPFDAEFPDDINGARYLLYPGDEGKLVKLHGAASGLSLGLIRDIYTEFHREGLSACFTVDMHSRSGDSGGAVVDGRGFILGFHVGRITLDGVDLAVASPAMLVLHKLGCTIPTK